MLESVSANGHSFESCKEELKKSESFFTPNSVFAVHEKREWSGNGPYEDGGELLEHSVSSESTSP